MSKKADADKSNHVVWNLHFAADIGRTVDETPRAISVWPPHSHPVLTLGVSHAFLTDEVLPPFESAA